MVILSRNIHIVKCIQAIKRYTLFCVYCQLIIHII
nr:MAG TPA: hypothetical protein [Caudoviricetes sp.]